MDPTLNYVFICGCPRSGTTALADLLNADDRAIIGRERFKFIADEVTPDHFSRNHFFFPTAEETNNLRVPSFYEKSLENWDSGTVTHLGDKVPLYVHRLSYLAETFPDCKIAFMFRDLEGVAASFTARAENADPDDSWPPSNDYRAAVVHWNEALRSLHRYVEPSRKDNVFVAIYERLFSGEAMYLELLYDFLGLPVTDQVVAAFDAATAGWEHRKRSSRQLPRSARQYLAEEREEGLERWCRSLVQVPAFD